MHIYLVNFSEEQLDDITAVLTRHQHTCSTLSSELLWDDPKEFLFPYALVMIYDTVLNEHTTTLFNRVKFHLPSSEIWLVSSSYRPEDVRIALKHGFSNYVLWSPDLMDLNHMVQSLTSYQSIPALTHSENIYELSQIAGSLMDYQMNVDQLISALINPGGSLSSNYLPLMLRHRELRNQHFILVLIKPILPIKLYFREDFDSVLHIVVAELRLHLNWMMNTFSHSFQMLLSVQENTLVCLFHSFTPDYTDEIERLLQNLNKRLQRYLGISILAGYSHPYTSPDKTRCHFRYISDNLRQGIFQDDTCAYLLDYENQYVNSTAVIDEYLSNNLPLAISNNDHDLFFNIIINITSLMQKEAVSYDFARSILLQTISRFARETDFYQMVERDFIEIAFARATLRIPFFFQFLSLCQLLQKLYMQAYHIVFDDDNNRLTRAMQYIKENYYQKITLQLIAGHLSLTPNYFCGWFKKKTGKNFFDMVKEYRINVAKDLLVNTDRKICDIAIEVGYPEVVSFNRVFKKKVGIPPGEYQQQRSARNQNKKA